MDQENYSQVPTTSQVSDALSEKTSIRYTIFIYFTVSALVAMLLSGVALYVQMSRQLTAVVQEESQAVLVQVNRSVDSYLRTIMKLSDSLYYGVIKNADLSAGMVNDQITLLYDNNKDSIANIALLSKDGELLEAVPARGQGGEEGRPDRRRDLAFCRRLPGRR